jgi:ferredoxin
MCEFCATHGEGKKWYLQARNYSADLLSDARRRNFYTDIGWNDPATLRNLSDRLDGELDRLNRAPGFVRAVLRWRIVESSKKRHYGQVVPIEDVERIFGFVDSIVRMACLCRHAGRQREQRYCYGVSIGPGRMFQEESSRQAGYLYGPENGGLETLTREEALAALREHERESLCHSVWTFITPFIGGVCNCDRFDCLAMRATVNHRLPMMFRAEYVAAVDPDLCNGCRACMRACQFGALAFSAASKKAIVDQRQCFGCGVCRAFCNKDAIRLLDRASVPAVARVW